MRSMTRKQVVDALVAHEDSPYGRATLETMDDDELAAAASSTGVGFDELAALARNRRSGGGGDLGFTAEGILTDGPAGEGSRGGSGGVPSAPGGGLAVQRKSGEDEDLGFTAANVLAGHRGKSVLDEEHEDEPAENVDFSGLGGPSRNRAGNRDGEDLGFEVSGVLTD